VHIIAAISKSLPSARAPAGTKLRLLPFPGEQLRFPLPDWAPPPTFASLADVGLPRHHWWSLPATPRRRKQLVASPRRRHRRQRCYGPSASSLIRYI